MPTTTGICAAFLLLNGQIVWTFAWLKQYKQLPQSLCCEPKQYPNQRLLPLQLLPLPVLHSNNDCSQTKQKDKPIEVLHQTSSTIPQMFRLVSPLIFAGCTIIFGCLDLPSISTAVEFPNSSLEYTRTNINSDVWTQKFKVQDRVRSEHKSGIQTYRWVFENGDITLPDIVDMGGWKLKHPKLLGSGAGGAVFVMQREPIDSTGGNVQLPPVALKVSWKGSTQAVANECGMLRKLQQSSTIRYGTPIGTVEDCLGEIPYGLDPTRTMIALQPVFVDQQASSLIDFLQDQDKLETAVTLIIRTMLHMLSANIVTIDVQPLISIETGQILFVDFTEAISIHEPYEDDEVIVVRNFINEMMILIPTTQLEKIASKIMLEELSNYSIKSRYVYEMLMEYNFSKETLDYIQQEMVPLNGF
jgi:hypothetical protein